MEETKEDFCASCLAIPIALIGAGVAGSSSSSKQHKTKKKILFWSGIITILIAIFVFIYFKFINCSQCRG